MRPTTIAVVSAATGLLAAAGSASASLTLLSGPQQGVHVGNLVVNGSFEVGAPAPNGPVNYWATGTTNTPFGVPGGWSSSGAPATYAYWGSTGSGPYYTNFGAALPDGQSGLYFGNLFTSVDQTPVWNANGTVSFANPPTFTPTYGVPAVLSQTVPTDLNPSPAYLLSFWVSGEDAQFGQWPDGVFGLRVTNVLPGDPIQYLTTPGGQSSLGSSIRFEYQFTPINPLLPVTIEFINWGHLNAWLDPNSGAVTQMPMTSELVLDDVIVNMVPAPGAAMVLGAGALLAARRRR